MTNPCLIKQGQVRIIGGSCRGRKIYFPNLPNLRPTPNRIRETLFNWLAPSIQGARCLDLFAGSGALSFEALSRGASYCLLLDSSKDVYTSLVQNQALLGFRNMDIICASFPYPTDLIQGNYDIVFIDPPFHGNLVQDVISWLINSNCIAEGALLYFESDSHNKAFSLPDNWHLLKDKKAGNVRYSLCEVGSK